MFPNTGGSSLQGDKETPMFDRFSWTRNKIEELTKDKPGVQIVDIGCHECPITREMTNCTWVDCQSYEAIANFIKTTQVLVFTRDRTGSFFTADVKQRGAPPIPREKFVQANAESLPFEDKQFEVAVATQLLAYPENPVAALKEIKRIAKQAIITIRNEKDWDPRYRTSRQTGMRFYTEDMLRQHLKEAEIEDYSFERLDYDGWSFFAVVIRSRVIARFISGIGASGATMVVRWLGLHPDVYSIWETGFIPNQLLYALTPESLSEFRNFIQNSEIFSLAAHEKEYWVSRELQILSELANSLVPDDLPGNRKRIGNFIDKGFTGLAKLNNKVIWVEKTPMNIFFCERLREYFGDEFRIISVEREPRDNICCVAFSKVWGPNDLFGAIDYWTINTKCALKSMSRIPERLYMRVSYEDFVYNQVAVGRKICQFLEIPWHKNFEAPMTTDTDIGRYKREFRLESTSRPIE